MYFINYCGILDKIQVRIKPVTLKYKKVMTFEKRMMHCTHSTPLTNSSHTMEIFEFQKVSNIEIFNIIKILQLSKVIDE